MLMRYQNFIDKHGKIVFPIYFILLYSLFVAPSVIYKINGNLRFDVASFYISIALPITMPISYPDYPVAYIPVLIIVAILSIIGIAFTIAFFVCYFLKNKTLHSALLMLPIIYILQTVFNAISYHGIPFIPFFVVLILFVLAILYCVKVSDPYESD